MNSLLFKRASALAPILMSLAALGIVISYAAMFGVARQTDEGTAAHLWQLLMAGQVPIILFFLLRWLPKEPKRTMLVLAFQLAAALSAMFPVWWFGW